MPLLRLLVYRRILATMQALRELMDNTVHGESEEELVVPEMVYNYAKRISEVTGLPLEEVLKSRPVRSYWRKLERKVRIRRGMETPQSGSA